MPRPVCLLIQPVHPDGHAVLTEAGILARMPREATVEAVTAELADVDAVITRDFGFPLECLNAAPRLKVIGNHGIGANRIAVATASSRGIPTVYTPYANARSVAEHAIGLMLAVARKTVLADRAVRDGDAGFKYRGGLIELTGKALGLVGFGTIGRMVAEIARTAFAMRAIVWSPGADSALIAAHGAERVTRLEELLANADVVSLHRPARPDSSPTLGAAELARMKPSAILINTARGALIDQAALTTALVEGRIAGAGLDVFEEEPLPPGDLLGRLDNVVLSPHVAGATEEALARTAVQVCEQVAQVLDGKRPPYLVDPSAWDRRRS